MKVNQVYLESTAVGRIPEKNIKVICLLGRGSFGTVHKAILDNGNGREFEVAIKSLNEQQEFMNEAKMMSSFRHPNILEIYGVTTSENPYQMVFEYMEEGDLTGVLRRLKLSNFPSENTSFLDMCCQIAEGMNYLSAINHVHRDLACRNCLVNKSNIIKIGDFGLCRNLYGMDYYRVKGKAVLPVRWMPPEAIFNRMFSKSSDVWSFGVVMWEVYTYALLPYYGKSNYEVTEEIRQGSILQIPDNCPAEVYNLMKECWSTEPQFRPNFNQLLQTINHLCQQE